MQVVQGQCGVQERDWVNELTEHLSKRKHHVTWCSSGTYATNTFTAMHLTWCFVQSPWDSVWRPSLCVEDIHLPRPPGNTRRSLFCSIIHSFSQTTPPFATNLDTNSFGKKHVFLPCCSSSRHNCIHRCRFTILFSKWRRIRFEEYEYYEEIHPDFTHSVVRWRLEQLETYNLYNGVTNS